MRWWTLPDGSTSQNLLLHPAVYWTKASDEGKSKVKEVFVPPVPEDSVQYKRYSSACAAMEEFSHIPAKEMMGFLPILRVNAHMAGDGTKTPALFCMGGKVAHSCEPCCMALAIGYHLVYPFRYGWCSQIYGSVKV